MLLKMLDKVFVTHEVEADHSRKLHSFIKEACNRLFHLATKLFERVAVLDLGLQLIEHGVSDLGWMRGRVDLF